jgi:hypothetical protein
MQVKQVCHSTKSLNPLSGRNASLKHERACNIIHNANNAFSTLVLWRGVRPWHAHGDALAKEKGAGASIIKLTTIIVLEAFNDAAKLCADICINFGSVKSMIMTCMVQDC